MGENSLAKGIEEVFIGHLFWSAGELHDVSVDGEKWEREEYVRYSPVGRWASPTICEGQILRFSYRNF